MTEEIIPKNTPSAIERLFLRLFSWFSPEKEHTDEEKLAALRLIWKYIRKNLGLISVGAVSLMANSYTNLMFPRMMLEAANSVARGDRVTQQKGFVLYSFVAISVGTMASFLRIYCLEGANFRMKRDLKTEVFGSVMSSSMEELHDKETGDILHLVSDRVDLVANGITEHIPSALRALSFSTLGVYSLLSLSPKLTLFAFTMLPLSSVLAVIIRKAGKKAEQLASDLKASSSTFLKERLGNIQVIKAYNASSFEQYRFSKLMMDSFSQANVVAWLKGLDMGSTNFLLKFSLLFTVLMGGPLLASKSISPGTLPAFVSQSLFAVLGFMGLTNVKGNMAELTASSLDVSSFLMNRDQQQAKDRFEWTKRLVAEREEEEEKMEEEEEDNNNNDPSFKPSIHSITFQDVYFSYPTASGSPRSVLKNLSFAMPHKGLYALIGKNGAGKSTLFKLLLRLYDPSSGDILFNKEEAVLEASHLSPSEIREHVGFVEQEAKLFNGSILENIVYNTLKSALKKEGGKTGEHKGREGEEAWTDEKEEALQAQMEALLGEVEQELHRSSSSSSLEKEDDESSISPSSFFCDVLRRSGVLDMVRGLKDGLNTPVGENGQNLSTGQKQRIAIARVLFKNPSVVLFDEPTSALDSAVVRVIQTTLDELAKDRIVLMIAHSEQLLANACKIFLLDEGSVSMEGTMDELMSQSSVVKDLFGESNGEE